MGIGFCLIVPDDPVVVRAVDETFAAHPAADAPRFETRRIGKVVEDPRKRVFLPDQHLAGEGDGFTPQ
jgi:hypothetical protein